MRRDRQTEGHSDKEFKVKGRANQGESPRWRGAGKWKKEKRSGQAQAGGRGAGGETDRQTAHPGHGQNFPSPEMR